MSEEKSTNIKAAPGVYLVEASQEESSVNYGKEENKKIIKGVIVDVGTDRDHDQGGKLVATLKAGATIWFLNYVENYDWFKEDGRKYYTVLFNDVRAYEEAK